MQIGWQEIMLLMVFALVVFGPKRLPEIGRQIGRAVAEVRKVSREFEREVRSVSEPFTKEVEEAERAAKQTYEMDPHHSKFLTKAPPEDAEPPANGESPA